MITDRRSFIAALLCAPLLPKVKGDSLRAIVDDAPGSFICNWPEGAFVYRPVEHFRVGIPQDLFEP